MQPPPIPFTISMSSLEKNLNRAIAKLLESDPANSAYLSNLDGSHIKIHSQLPEIKMLVCIESGELQIRQFEESIDIALSVSGTALNLIRLLTTPLENASNLSQSGVEVSGDVGLLLELSRLSEKIEIDWEALLAEQISETPAVILSRTINTGLSEAKKLQADLSEKLKQEFKKQSSLPDKTELEELKTRLRELNYRLDRLEAIRNKEQK